MHRLIHSTLSALALAGLAGSLFAAENPATVPTTLPTTSPATAPAQRTKFEAGDHVDALLAEIAMRYDAVLVKAKPTDALILKDVEMPGTLEESLKLAQSILEPQGLG